MDQIFQYKLVFRFLCYTRFVVGLSISPKFKLRCVAPNTLVVKLECIVDYLYKGDGSSNVT